MRATQKEVKRNVGNNFKKAHKRKKSDDSEEKKCKKAYTARNCDKPLMTFSFSLWKYRLDCICRQFRVKKIAFYFANV